MAGCKESKLLESFRRNYSIKKLDGPNRDDTQLDLLFDNKEAGDGHVVISGILSYSDHQVMVLELLKGVRKDGTEPELHKKRFQLI